MTLDKLIEKAREYRSLHELREEEKKEQAVSIAHGNVYLHKQNVTREMVKKEADKLYGK